MRPHDPSTNVPLKRPRRHTTAGKTATINFVSPPGPAEGKGSLASFIGFAPLINPRMLVYVAVISKDKVVWGAENAAPVYLEATERILEQLGVPPDVSP